MAELARLIGQNDPFAQAARGSDHGATRDARHDGYAAPAASDWRAAPAEDHGYHASTHRYDAPHQSYSDRDPAPGGYAVQPASTDDRYGNDRYATAPYAPHAGAAQDDGYGDDPHSTYRDDAYDPRAAQSAQEDIYDDPPRGRHRGRLATAVVLIGCAMVGSGAAYGYRTWYANPGRSEPPPVIAADKTPSKIAAAGDNQAGKAIHDRIGGNNAPERVVSREEQPLPLKEPAAANPRVVLAAPVAPGQVPAGAAPNAAPAPAVAAPGEPKRIRTVPIRPDGSEARASATPASPFPPAAPQNLAPAAQQPSAAPVAPARPATPPRAAAPARGNAPMSLNPSGNDASEPAPPAPRMAAVTPAPARSSNTAAATTGGYVVQVSSQRSEAEAQASFRSLQAKFPGVLGGRQALVKRADLGEKGTFYRAMVGPFGTSDDATKFCGSLKAAGGQCIIQRN